MAEPIEAASDIVDPASPDPVEMLMRQEAVKTAVSRFAELPTLQRSVVILKDVLDESLIEIAALLDLTVDAVKGHLARGRARLREINAQADQRQEARPASAAVARYVALFNQQDWDGLRALLADDVKLIQSAHPPRIGSAEVGRFFTIYAKFDWVWLAPAWLEGREVIAVFENRADPKPDYVMWLDGATAGSASSATIAMPVMSSPMSNSHWRRTPGPAGATCCKNRRGVERNCPFQVSMFMICSFHIIFDAYDAGAVLSPRFPAQPGTRPPVFRVARGRGGGGRVMQLRDRLCHENGLKGRRIATDLLHVTLRGIGAYHGLPNFVIERAREAGATVSTSPFRLLFDRAMSFNGGQGKRPLVLSPPTILRDCSGFVRRLAKR